MGRVKKIKKTLSFASFNRSCRTVKSSGIIPADRGGKFRSWVSSTDRWNPLEQYNPYISIFDNFFWQLFNEPGVFRGHIEKQPYRASFL